MKRFQLARSFRARLFVFVSQGFDWICAGLRFCTSLMRFGRRERGAEAKLRHIPMTLQSLKTALIAPAAGTGRQNAGMPVWLTNC